MNLETTQYKDLIKDIKQKIQTSQIKAHIKVNVELLKLYWELASMIVEKQKLSSWGDGFIADISKDLKKEFPNLKGFSTRNIKYMRQWYIFYSGDMIKGQQLVAQLQSNIFQIPWGHNIVVITKCESLNEANFYLNKIIENNYSRAVLIHQFETNLYERTGKAITNFESKLPNEKELKDIEKPLGVGEYKITDILPKEYESSLPSIEQIELELKEI
ncbi:MAG: DUF1016 N-terminal domain-containing protein [Campylobacterota bacterium]|nr:DUF1016 N-terminal domain-containing protein [Campylobacterota bacterium]